MKPTLNQITKALMMYQFGNLNPDAPHFIVNDVIEQAREIHERWDDEPEWTDPEQIVEEEEKDEYPLCF